MVKEGKEFYVWIMAECIKDTYENWGIDITSMMSHIKKDFPKISKAFYKLPGVKRQFTFEDVGYVYEAISLLIPKKYNLKFDVKTKELNAEYDWLNICSFREFTPIRRTDLILAILLFTEEFIFEPITASNVVFTKNKLTIYGNYVTFKISKHKDKTYVYIKIQDVITLCYMILNK